MITFSVIGNITRILGIKVRINRIIASDYVLTSSCIVPTIGKSTGIVSDYPIEKEKILERICEQYKVFLVNNGVQCEKV